MPVQTRKPAVPLNISDGGESSARGGPPRAAASVGSCEVTLRARRLFASVDRGEVASNVCRLRRWGSKPTGVLDNVTIIMLVAPVTLVICDRLDIAAQPFLIAEVLASNIGGAATLIGDPPNIIIGSRAGLTFNDFLVNMAPVVLVIFVLFVLFTKVLFRKDLRSNTIGLDQVMALQERRAIKDTRLLVRSMAVLGLVVVGFSLHSVLHVAPSIVALLGAGTMLLVTNVDVAEILPEVEWPTLVFFMGLFAMVAGLVHTGVIGWLGDHAVAVFGDNFFAAATGLLFGSAVLGAFVDNIPYTATMTPVVEGMVAQAPDNETGRGLWWAFALGACFSGNGTAIAASANVVVNGKRESGRHPVAIQGASQSSPPRLASATR